MLSDYLEKIQLDAKKKNKPWTKRWFVLEGNTLSYYDNQKAKNCKGSYSLGKGKITCDPENLEFELRTDNYARAFRTKSVQAFREWVCARLYFTLCFWCEPACLPVCLPIVLCCLPRRHHSFHSGRYARPRAFRRHALPRKSSPFSMQCHLILAGDCTLPDYGDGRFWKAHHVPTRRPLFNGLVRSPHQVRARS